MAWRVPTHLRWPLLYCGVCFLAAGLYTVRDAGRNSPVPQRLTLQELLDGHAGENRYVAITDFRLCRRYAKRGYRNQPGPKRWISHIGIVPKGSGDEFGQIRVIVEPENANEQNYLIKEWTEKDALVGELKKPARYRGWERDALNEAYPELDFQSCSTLLEGRAPPTVADAKTYALIGAVMVAIALVLWRFHRRRIRMEEYNSLFHSD
jgi:hypothetical protein